MSKPGPAVPDEKSTTRKKGHCWLCEAKVTRGKSPSIFYAPMGLEGIWVIVCQKCHDEWEASDE